MSNFYYKQYKNRFPLFQGDISRYDYPLPPAPYTLSYGGNPPTNTLLFRFIAEDNWQFGRTQFYIGLSATYSFGFTVSGATIWEQTSTLWSESTAVDMSISSQYIIPNVPWMIFEPNGGGSGVLVAGQAYWISFNLISNDSIDIQLANEDISGYMGTYSTNSNYAVKNGPWGTAIAVDNLWLHYIK